MISFTNEAVIKLAKELGFDLVGFAPVKKPDAEISHLEEWLKRNYHAGMEYMEKNISRKSDVKELLPSAKSIVSLGMNYYKGEEHTGNPAYGKISRYAWGKDYHLVIWEKLDILMQQLKDIDPEFEAVSYVDTGPVMDKVWAVQSGLGWMGKHTNVINKEIGSWFFIAVLITNKDFSPSLKIDDFCGTCMACIDSCPTNALEEYVLDANKCISYLTIENKNEIPSMFKDKFKGWLFGCDICQEVCPWNKKFQTISGQAAFKPINVEINLDGIEKMEQAEFAERFGESPLKRAKLKGLKRNAAFLKE